LPQSIPSSYVMACWALVSPLGRVYARHEHTANRQGCHKLSGSHR
jgi:hypothetical protein